MLFVVKLLHLLRLNAAALKLARKFQRQLVRQINDSVGFKKLHGRRKLHRLNEFIQEATRE